jgi:hypothetical protein
MVILGCNESVLIIQLFCQCDHCYHILGSHRLRMSQQRVVVLQSVASIEGVLGGPSRRAHAQPRTTLKFAGASAVRGGIGAEHI